MDNDLNKIKLDVCFINNGIFNDVNCLYFLNIVKKKSDLKKAKNENAKESKEKLLNEIKELVEEGLYFKALKRQFSLLMLEKKIGTDVLNVLNSDYGILYKFINSLELIVSMCMQKFKPLDIQIIYNNIQTIKEFGRSITHFNIDEYLRKLNEICLINNREQIALEQDKIINNCEKILDSNVKRNYSNLLK
jgi:hypothetical protein